MPPAALVRIARPVRADERVQGFVVRALVAIALVCAVASALVAGERASRYGAGAWVPWLLASVAWLAALVVYGWWVRMARLASERRLAAQYAIARVLSDARTVEDATPRIMEAVCVSLGWDLGALWQTDGDEGRLRLIDVWVPATMDADVFAAESPHAVPHRGEGMLGRCWDSATAVWVSDLEHEPLERRGLLLALGFRSGFCFPISSAGEVIGVMEFISSRRRRLDPDLLAAVDAAGAQIGQFIRRRQAEAHAEELDKERHRLMAQIVRAEEEERARIAAALHDDTIQVLAATLISLDRFAGKLAAGDGDGDGGRRVLATARATIEVAVERARTLMFELRPPLLEANGLAPAITDAAAQASEEAGFTPIVDINLGRYPQPVEALVYRTVQEAISNAKKHADASTVRVCLEETDGAIHGIVEDDGRGFDLERALDRSRMRLHLGLDVLAERMRIVGGDLVIRSAPGQGTRVEFHSPI